MRGSGGWCVKGLEAVALGDLFLSRERCLAVAGPCSCLMIKVVPAPPTAAVPDSSAAHALPETPTARLHQALFSNLHHTTHSQALLAKAPNYAGRAQAPPIRYQAEYINTQRQPMDGTWAPKSPGLSSYYSPEEVPLHPQHQGYRGSVSHAPPFITPSSSPAQYDKTVPPAFQPQLQPQQHFMPRGVRQQESMQDADYMPDESVSLGKMPDTGNGTGGGSTLPPNVDNIIIKNHFPVARIKRIMQADDDVGKVAQVTPVVVCTCLDPSRHF